MEVTTQQKEKTRLEKTIMCISILSTYTLIIFWLAYLQFTVTKSSEDVTYYRQEIKCLNSEIQNLNINITKLATTIEGVKK